MGPRTLYPLEDILQCMHGKVQFDIPHPLSASDDEYEHNIALRRFCAKLMLAVYEKNHFQALDALLSTLLPGIVHNHPEDIVKPPVVLTRISSAVVEKTATLISRLPDTPIKLYTLPLFKQPAHLNTMAKALGSVHGLPLDEEWFSKYVLPEGRPKYQPRPSADLHHLSHMQSLAWGNLWVTAYIDISSTCFALLMTSPGNERDFKLAEALARHVDTLSELLKTYGALTSLARYSSKDQFKEEVEEDSLLSSALWPQDLDTAEAEKRWLVVEVFLWTAWQRSGMLLFYYIIGVQIAYGARREWSQLFARRGTGRLDDLGWNSDGSGALPEYMCSWAFEMLRTDRSSLFMDFRHLLLTFRSHFGGRAGRCIPITNGQCDSRGALPCQRFVDSEARSQSIHDELCNGECTQIAWDESSYRFCPNPCAVDLISSSSTLHYVPANSQTLAISHVWSHGQGGRPESGINSCLHARYSRLARKLDCQSYWIDSACISSNDKLRKQAISKINDVFTQSKATLIIDIDIVAVNIKDYAHDRTKLAEILLSILLVCDWSVRAWTMLEAIRGSRSLYILCHDDQIIAVEDLLRIVLNNGAITLAILLGCAQHLLPMKSSTNKSIEEAAALLSRRHTSKQHDEVVIWELLCGHTKSNNVVQMWQTQRQVRTAFLISSAPRVQDVPGFRWCPTSPYARYQEYHLEIQPGIRQLYSLRFPPYDCSGSSVATISGNGLLGVWRYIEVDADFVSYMADIDLEKSELDDVEGVESWALLKDSNNNTLSPDGDLQPYSYPDQACGHFLMRSLLAGGARVRVLRPTAEDRVSPYTGADERGEGIGLVSAICASFDNGETWMWQAVHTVQEPDDEDRWTAEEMFLV